MISPHLLMFPEVLFGFYLMFNLSLRKGEGNQMQLFTIFHHFTAGSLNKD